MTFSVRTLTFAVGTLLTLGTSAQSASLTPTEITDQIIGQRIQANYLGAPMTVLYDPAGEVQVTGADMSGTGTWRMTDTEICVNMLTGPNLGETCMTVTAQGGGIYSTSSGMSLTIASR